MGSSAASAAAAAVAVNGLFGNSLSKEALVGPGLISESHKEQEIFAMEGMERVGSKQWQKKMVINQFTHQGVLWITWLHRK